MQQGHHVCADSGASLTSRSSGATARSKRPVDATMWLLRAPRWPRAPESPRAPGSRTSKATVAA
eukprot:360367-Chlamydomonas_euryale.AAC.2